MMEFAGHGFDLGAGFGGDQRAAVHRCAAPDHFLDAHDRRRSAEQFNRVVAASGEARRSVGKHERVCR